MFFKFLPHASCLMSFEVFDTEAGDAESGNVELLTRLDSLGSQLSGLHALIDSAHMRHTPENGFTASSDYDSLLIQISELQQAVKDWNSGRRL